jgi:hypothetical protein
MSENQKPVTIAEVDNSLSHQSSTLAMQGKLRQAIFDSISESDVTAMVKKQVDKAKAGDAKSLEFVMKYVLGFGQPVTLQQINVTTDVEGAARLARSNKR